MDHDYKHLLSLLDDENEQSASLAMAELLARDQKTLEPVLRKLQESSDPRLRRRIHQLQSTITLRRRRKSLTRNLSERSIDLLEGLIQIHLLWYDNDAYDTVKKQWETLVEESGKYHPETLEQLAYFMRKHSFVCSHRDEMESEFLCLGTILDENTGADFMLCAIACLLAARCWFRSMTGITFHSTANSMRLNSGIRRCSCATPPPCCSHVPRIQTVFVTCIRSAAVSPAMSAQIIWISCPTLTEQIRRSNHRNAVYLHK